MNYWNIMVMHYQISSMSRFGLRNALNYIDTTEADNPAIELSAIYI
jgi:hypothetical protein